MRRTIIVTGGVPAANAMIAALMPAEAIGAQVAANDPEIITHNVKYDGKAGPVVAYPARPAKAGKYPAMIIIRDVARRFASRVMSPWRRTFFPAKAVRPS
jgi:hypothetical protein